MRPSGKNTILDTRQEMKTIELGAGLLSVNANTLIRHIDAGAYSKDPSDPLYGCDPMRGQLPLRNTDAITVTTENREIAVDSLKAVVALNGLEGIKAAVLGRKRVAKAVLQELNS